MIVPNIQYPANPRSVGEPDTIGYRTGLFCLTIAIPVATMVFSVRVRRHLLAKLEQWNASIVVGLVFVAIIAAVQIGLPSVSELPAGFPAALLWKFRVAAIGMQVIMWTTIGLPCGAWVECGERVGMRAA